MSCWAIVAAAGQGTRMGLKMNKAFAKLQGRPMLYRTLDALFASSLYAGVVVVLRDEDRPEFERGFEHAEKCIMVRGGESRQASVMNGLRALPDDCEYVAVHDAARPFVTREILENTLASALKYGSGVACTLVTDTIKSVDGGPATVRTLDRSLLRAVQTPQVFERGILLAAHEWALEENITATDDAALLEKCGYEVHLVISPSGSENLKLTTPQDMYIANKLLMKNLRVGYGFDVHRLVPGRELILCGVHIPHETGLLGHSDADVAVHALMDALLGACALGDIGRLFPDNDDKYLGADSLELLRQVVEVMYERGFSPRNADITIVAQRPKLAPYNEQMRANVARAMGVDADCVGVKATTTEGLGFEGEQKGISAHCVATVVEYTS